MLRDLRTCVVLGYGSTETLTHVALRPLNGPDASELYTAQGDVTFAQSEDGRLVIRTPHLSVKEHVTNDAAEVLDERRMRWLGRRDNVILSGGRKIHPERSWYWKQEVAPTGSLPVHWRASRACCTSTNDPEGLSRSVNSRARAREKWTAPARWRW